MKIIKLNPQGFCSGVANAIKIALEARENSSETIYLLDELVHNDFVNQELKKRGIIFLDASSILRIELLSSLKDSIVIFGAHGSTVEEYSIAKKNNLKIIDTTCKFVLHTMNKIRDKISEGYQIIYIGYKKHKEAIANKSIDKNKINIIEDINDLNNLSLSSDKIFVVSQTTLLKSFVDNIYAAIKIKFPTAIFEEHRCLATTRHQDAVLNINDQVDGIIVVSDKKSNNGNELLKLSKTKVGMSNAILINSLEDLELKFLASHNYLAITSAASTPNSITEAIYQFILNFNIDDPSTYAKSSKTDYQII